MNTAMYNYTTRGSRKGPADPQLPDQWLLCGARKVSRCNRHFRQYVLHIVWSASACIMYW